MQENAASVGYNAGYDLPCYIRQSGLDDQDWNEASDFY